MKKVFRGRVLFPGNVSGTAVVTRRGFNTLASFYNSILTGTDRAVCGDQDNPDLYKKNLTAKILCLPYSIGSTSAGATWDKVAAMGIAPKALLFSNEIDSLAAAGLALADVWVGKRIVAVDRLGKRFLAFVKDGMRVEVWPDGAVMISYSTKSSPARKGGRKS